MQQGPPNPKEKDNPALSKVIERNIRTIIHLSAKAARERTLRGRIADASTSFSGRMIFVYFHMERKPGQRMYWLKSTVFKQLDTVKSNHAEQKL